MDGLTGACFSYRSFIESDASSSILQVIDLDKTPVTSLEPLKQLKSLQKVYCDQSGVQKSTANDFMLSRPGVIVIYESEALGKWWSDLAYDWKNYFRQDEANKALKTL